MPLLFEPIGKLRIKAFEQPSVDVERERCRVVTEAHLDRLRMRALGNGEGRAGVSQIVEAKRREASAVGGIISHLQ